MNENAHILVVDDDGEIRAMVKNILELEGYDVAVAADGKASLAQMKKRKPALVLLDIMMPELNGFQVLELIRKRSDVPVIMLSAIGDPQSISDAYDLGTDDYLRKPFSSSELLTKVDTALRWAIE